MRVPRSLLVLLAATFSFRAAGPPATPKTAVIDTYGSTRVTDNYQWLETASDPKVKAWVADQNRYSRDYLDHLSMRTALHHDIDALLHQNPTSRYGFVYVGGHYFYRKFDAKQQQRMLFTTDSVDDLSQEKAVVDPNALDNSGHLSIDWFVPSLDGSLVGVALSQGGSEVSSLHIYQRESRHEIDQVIPRVNFPTGGGSMVWLPGNQSFLYTRYPSPGERAKADEPFYQQVYEHRLGTPVSADRYVLGKEFPRIAETVLSSDRAGKHIVVSVANGDGGEFEHFLRLPDGRFQQITHFADKVVAIKAGEDNALYLLSRQGADRGKILRVPTAQPDLAKAQLLIPEDRSNIEELSLVTENSLYLTTIDGGPHQVKVFELSGKQRPDLPVPPVSSVDNVLEGDGHSVLVGIQSYIQPRRILRLRQASLVPTAIALPANPEAEKLTINRLFAPSKDGTKVPMTVIAGPGYQADGKHAVLVYGYGGYGISMTPFYLGTSAYMVWLRSGNALVITNLRGGAEYGEAWHQQGRLTSKQNVFDDFAGCVRYLIDHNYAQRDKVAAVGGSNGGLLMGAALTQHPELFGAVVSFVGIYDMLRVERDANGEFNVTEFGSVKQPEQFRALYAYSPYHHVDTGVSYPAVLFMTGDNDGRVDPLHSRKMTARLQEATKSTHPILLRTSSTTGHGIGSSLNDQVEQQVDMFAFLYDQLGLKY